MEGGRHNLETGSCGASWHAELRSRVSGACVARVLIYVCVKCGHASALRRLGGRPKARGTGHALNARMLGTPLSAGFPETLVSDITYWPILLKSPHDSFLKYLENV